MDLLLWITIGFIIIGFVVLTSIKKGMESKLAFIKVNMEGEESLTKAKSIIAFGYVCGMGLEHGYMEDIIVDPEYQKQGIGVELVKELLRESERFGLGIVTVTYAEENTKFYKTCGFTPGSGGVFFN